MGAWRRSIVQEPKVARLEPVPNWSIDSAKLECEGQRLVDEGQRTLIRIIYIMEHMCRFTVFAFLLFVF